MKVIESIKAWIGAITDVVLMLLALAIGADLPGAGSVGTRCRRLPDPGAVLAVQAEAGTLKSAPGCSSPAAPRLIFAVRPPRAPIGRPRCRRAPRARAR